MFEGFIHPALAFGALLASVPLLIHLLNRQRHRPLEWAAMKFVLAAYRKTRRRAQLENLLLLLLRMAAVALLAFCVARPFIGKDSPLAPLTESRRDLVLVVDGSASTGYRENVQTVFEVVVERARTILTSLDGTRGDRVRLVFAAGSPRLLSARAPEDALAVLSTLTAPAHEPLDLGMTFAEIARYAEEDAAGTGESGLEVRLLTDLQRGAFTPEVSAVETYDGGASEPAVPALFAALDKLDALGVRVIVEDHGPSAIDPPNLAVESVSTFGPVLGPGAPVEVGVTIASYGSGGPATARVALEIDGERQPSRQVEIAGRGRTEVVFAVTFADDGYHTVTAKLEGDRLPIDDTRARIVPVPPPLRVLLVNGEPAAEIERDEIGFLRAVLEPPDEASFEGSLASGGRSPFVPRVVNDLGFAGGDVDLADFDVYVLANTPAPERRTMERLEAQVAAGKALLITGGANVAASSADWNERFFRPDGSGLLPAELGRPIEVPDRRTGYYRAASFDDLHPALAFFADERWQPYLTEVPIWGFLSTRPRDDARVLARIDDDDKSPLLIERAYDRGRVFLWTTTIDNAWTKLPESPATLVPLTHELLRYAGRGSEPSRNVPVGTALVAEVSAFPRGLSVVPPDGSRRSLDGEPTQIGEGLWSLPAVGPTDQVGTWTIEREDAPDIVFSVQLDPAESDLLRISGDELETLHPALHLAGADESSGSDDPDEDPRRGELWRWLAFLCLAALVAETLWAAWIGFRRRIA